MTTQAVNGQGLCEVCQKISLESLLAAEGFEHISDYNLLFASGKQYRMCSLISDSIHLAFGGEALNHWYGASDSPRFTILRGLKRESFGLDHILVCCGFVTNTFEHQKDRSIIPPGTSLVGRLEISAEEQDPAAKFVKIRRLPRDLGSEDSMFMAAQLLDECTNMHPLCRAPQTTSLPTRVLDVGSVTDETIFLLISEDCKARYAALSYCWGGRQEVVANESSWEAMTQGFALSVLSKIIQDAVTVTRRLGLQYLWVDALCIKQDSEEDWTSESSRMGDIHGNATITIAAAGGSTCNTGCFIQDSSSTAHLLDNIRLRLPDLSSGTISISVQNNHDTWKDPLNQRAWALQERLLSPRLLIYSSGKLSWQCQTKGLQNGIGSARLPNLFFKGIPVNSDEMKGWKMKGWKMKGWSMEVGKNDLRTLEDSWSQISLDYSRRSITYDGDRLPALSGLARKFQELTGDVYLAGLWRKVLYSGLMWNRPRTLKSRPSKYIAPTWSWLNSQGPIHCVQCALTRDSRPFCEILEAETVSVGSDETGAVLSGKITLYGQIKQARQKVGKELWGVIIEERVGSSLLDFQSELVDAIDGPLWCLRVFEDKGLLLKRSGDNYQRVGIFVININTDAKITGQTWFEDSESRTLTLV